jgi:hypothetical protein
VHELVDVCLMYSVLHILRVSEGERNTVSRDNSDWQQSWNTVMRLSVGAYFLFTRPIVGSYLFSAVCKGEGLDSRTDLAKRNIVVSTVNQILDVGFHGRLL